MNRKTAVGLFSFGGILLGIGIGFLIWGMKKETPSLAGKDCTVDGRKGKTDNNGVCKAV